MQGSIGPRESERTWRLLGSDCGKLANCRARHQQISAGALEQIDKSFPNHRFTYSLGH
jgi:hypothetical protein